MSVDLPPDRGLSVSRAPSSAICYLKSFLLFLFSEKPDMRLALLLPFALSGCLSFSSSNPPPPSRTTIIVLPPGSTVAH
jgi:hypothetical protein